MIGTVIRQYIHAYVIYIYLHIEVVLSAVRSHNVLIVVIMLTYALCTERVARIAACQVYLDSRDTDL